MVSVKKPTKNPDKSKLDYTETGLRDWCIVITFGANFSVESGISVGMKYKLVDMYVTLSFNHSYSEGSRSGGSQSRACFHACLQINSLVFLPSTSVTPTPIPG